MEDIEELLRGYEPGEPKMKPDVLEQTKRIEDERKKLMMEQNKQQLQNQNSPGTGIMVHEPGKSPRMLLPDETLKLIQSQQQEIESLKDRNKELEDMVINLQTHIMKMNNTENTASTNDTISISI